jgi:gamma-glutamyl:cysteine ligase YbdK (ATP-grasp superfamily)
VVGFHPVDKPQAGIVKFVHNEDSYIDHARELDAVGYLVRQTSARLLARPSVKFTARRPSSPHKRRYHD